MSRRSLVRQGRGCSCRHGARGVDVERLVLPNELHEFELHRSWLTAYSAAADFFDRHLKSQADPVQP